MPRRPDSEIAGLDAPQLSGIRRLSALEAVRARIALAVDLGLLSPGDRLPASDEIAEALGVSEITARRALVSLCKDGVLERRRGRGGGTLVAADPAKGVIGATDAYRSDSATVRLLIEHRLAFECGIAHLAATHADGAAIERLAELVDTMDRVPSWAEFHRCDERFHLALAAATGSPSLTVPYGTVLRDLYRYFLPYPMEALRESNAEHRQLVDALRRRDPAAAALIAQSHVEVLRRTMFIGLVETGTDPGKGAATGPATPGGVAGVDGT
ncbi:FCD domain-containing protein [Streptomyces sp. 150FB]|uniref:FadR/GntR family transcriptional regulator n=1 Tax=Streptomyces sp. 150FB TaxID=1576605 RepID=UPI0007C7250D|nr:FCD domain-containing protein [Streptomyces sp. 150FB]